MPAVGALSHGGGGRDSSGRKEEGLGRQCDFEGGRWIGLEVGGRLWVCGVEKMGGREEGGGIPPEGGREAGRKGGGSTWVAEAGGPGSQGTLLGRALRGEFTRHARKPFPRHAYAWKPHGENHGNEDDDSAGDGGTASDQDVAH